MRDTFIKTKSKAVKSRLIMKTRILNYSLLTLISFSLPVAIGTNSAHGQNLDSLYGVWQDETQHDSSRTKAFQHYIWSGYVTSNPDTAIALSERLIAYSKKNNYPLGEAKGFNNIAASYFNKKDFTKTLENYNYALKIYEELGEDRRVAKLLARISNVYEQQGDLDKAIEYVNQSITISEKVGYKAGVGTALNSLGKLFKMQGKYAMAINVFNRELKYNIEIEDSLNTAGSFFNIGSIYVEQGMYDKALEYIKRSLIMFEGAKSERGVSLCLSNIGIIYLYQENFTEALKYCNRSLNLSTSLGLKNDVAATQNLIGNVYSDQGNYTMALDYYNQALQIAEEIVFEKLIADLLNNIGLVYSRQGDYTNALAYFHRSLKQYEQFGLKKRTSGVFTNIGDIYLSKRQYDEALKYCMQGLALAEEVNVLKDQSGPCQCIYQSYKAIGNGNMALIYMEKMKVIDDSLNAQETTQKLQQMEFAKTILQDSIAKAEEARLVQEAHQEEVAIKNRTRNMLAGGGMLLLLIAGGLYSRNRYIKKSRDTISKEKDRSDNLLLNILPADIAAELKENGKAEARDFENVSILFTDFKEFTQTSAKLSAKELVAEINICFEAFDSICKKYNVEKIKTIGDAYMAAGGLPIPTAESTKNTVLAALEMQAFITSRKAENDAAGKPAFEMRAGIHTGPVVAGIVGATKFQYDIWGDTVNTASRMESAGEVGKVNISNTTYEIIKDEPHFDFEHRGKIEAKGKGEVDMWFVTVKN
mgnify:CR=1 FL=1